MSPPPFDRFYFGCGAHNIGHYFWLPSQSFAVSSFDMETAQPWGFKVDGSLQPQHSLVDEQGPCALHRKDGWTAIAWWDRTMDKRGASCSVFAMRGEHSFDAMVAAFRESFPWAAQRMGFELVLVQQEARHG